MCRSNLSPCEIAKIVLQFVIFCTYVDTHVCDLPLVYFARLCKWVGEWWVSGVALRQVVVGGCRWGHYEVGGKFILKLSQGAPV